LKPAPDGRFHDVHFDRPIAGFGGWQATLGIIEFRIADLSEEGQVGGAIPHGLFLPVDFHDDARRSTMSSNPLDLSHKAALDSLLLKIPGITGGEMSGLPAYFVANHMFACIWNGGVGVRLPPSEAANLQFLRENVVPFEPKGQRSTREWIQINRDNSADYEKDLSIFQSSIDYVRGRKP
jgi:hypothetical protein